MRTNSTHRQRMIAKIKIAQKQLGMDDDTYRAMLARITGKRSSTQLTATELAQVLRELERLGFIASTPKPAAKPLHRSSHSPMFNKIAVLLAQTNKTWAYADGMAQKMFGVDKANQLDSKQLHSLLAALQIYTHRQQKT